MKRLVWAVLVLTACGAEELHAPDPSFHRDDAGALLGTFPAQALADLLEARGLPAPSPALGAVEGGSCEAFAEALDQLADAPNADAYGRVGLFFQASARLDLAEACFEAAVERESEGARWLHHLGDLAERREDVDRATELFEAAVRADPTASAPRVRLIRALGGGGRTAEAIAAAEDLLELKPSSLTALTELAAAALDRGDVAAAEPLLGRALNAWPRMRQVHLLAARMHAAAGRTEEAERHRVLAADGIELGLLTVDPWMAQLERDTDSLVFWKASAEELQRAGRWPELLVAVRELDRRQGGPIWKGKEAQTLLYLRRGSEARTVAQRLAKEHPSAPHGPEVLGLIELDAGRPAAALSCAESALERDPRSRVGTEVLVKSALAMGMESTALEAARTHRAAFQEALEPVLLELMVRRTLWAAATADGRRSDAALHASEGAVLKGVGERLAPGDKRLARASAWL